MPSLSLELSLSPDHARQLAKLPEFAGSGRSGRATSLGMIWHDTPQGELAASGLSLAECRRGRETVWRLERVQPADAELWAPGTSTPLVREASDPAEFADAAPAPLMAVAAFEGQTRALPARDAATVLVMSGELRAVSGVQPLCRVMLQGEACVVASLARGLAERVALSVPATSLAGEAFAKAGAPMPARRLGAPSLPPSLGVDDAFAFLVAHLLDVVLYHAPLTAAGLTPEPVHQMRVAVRRLRSAFGLFKRVVGCREFDEAKAELKAFGHLLGPARDWDVFVAGTCATVVAAFPGDAAVARLATTARRRRDEGYSALVGYLSGAGFRRLALDLALLAAAKPWRNAAELAILPASGATATIDVAEPPAHDNVPVDLETFAIKALGKRLKHVLAPGAHIDGLPPDELHAVRLNGKRLRYAAEFFAPLFPGRETRRYLRRMTKLQQRLGELNDGAVAAGLLAEIGQARAYGGGLVRGVLAAGAADIREEIGRSWRRFRKHEPFWA